MDDLHFVTLSSPSTGLDRDPCLWTRAVLPAEDRSLGRRSRSDTLDPLRSDAGRSRCDRQASCPVTPCDCRGSDARRHGSMLTLSTREVGSLGGVVRNLATRRRCAAIQGPWGLARSPSMTSASASGPVTPELTRPATPLDRGCWLFSVLTAAHSSVVTGAGRRDRRRLRWSRAEALSANGTRKRRPLRWMRNRTAQPLLRAPSVD